MFAFSTGVCFTRPLCDFFFFLSSYGCTFWKTVYSLLLRLLADCWEYSRKGIGGYLDRSHRQSFCVFSTS